MRARPRTRNLLSYVLSVVLLLALAAFAILVALQLRGDTPPRFDVGEAEGIDSPVGGVLRVLQLHGHEPRQSAFARGVQRDGGRRTRDLPQ